MAMATAERQTQQWPYYCQLCGAGCPERYHEPHNDRMVCADCYTEEVGDRPDEEQGLHRIDRYRNDDSLVLSLTVGDVQEEAEHLIGRRLNDDELRRVGKGLDYYRGELLAEYLEEAIQQATG